MFRSLELFGFKSFADKTVFEFSAGLTGVVGPNGSGKSNVVDAIKWILGDQSPRSLRGREMTDVIFSGSSARGAAQFAEATLVFDNSSRFLPVDVDEVCVGRRLWNSGDSEYLINRSAVRLKDVRELFSGTGAGAAAYCIIEQGRVDQILQSNAANRRLIFEEAAGISRLKTRKTEAGRRLERVEQNLLRLTDIVDEVESQVNAVRSQAQRAARFHAVSTELEELWVGMACDDYRRQTLAQNERITRRDQAAETLREARERRAGAEQQSADAEQALGRLDVKIREMEAGRADLRSQIASLNTTMRHQAERETELGSEITRLRHQLDVMHARTADAEREAARLGEVMIGEQTQLDRRRQQQAAAEQRLKSLRSGLVKTRERIEKTREQLLSQIRKNSNVGSHISSLESERETLVRRQNSLSQDLERRSTEQHELTMKLTQQNRRLLDTRQILQEVQNAADHILAGRESIVRDQQKSRESLGQLREQRSGTAARRSVLEDLEKHQKGFGIGVREILRRAEESSQEPWSLIRGSVAELLDVDMEHAALLEVALCGRSQLLVVDRLGPLVDYLASGRCHITGRVGFVSLESASLPPTTPDQQGRAETVSEEPATQINSSSSLPATLQDSDRFSLSLEFAPELKVTWVDSQSSTVVHQSVFSSQASPVLTGQPGVIGRADSLAGSPDAIPHLAALLLADTWVVSSVADAMRVVEETDGAVRAITAHGELVEKDGTLHTGTIHIEAAVLSRKSELRRLRKELHRIDRLIAEREHQLKRLVDALDTSDVDLQAAREVLNSAMEENAAAEQDVTGTRQAQWFVQQRITDLQQQLQNAADEFEDLRIRIESGRSELRSGEHTLPGLQKAIADTEARITDDQRQLEELEAGRTEVSLELTRLEERALSLRDAAARLNEDLEQRRLQQQEAGRRLNASRQVARDLTLAMLNVRAELAELHIADDTFRQRLRDSAESRRFLTDRRRQATEEVSEARDICREHESRFHELELQIRSLEHQLVSSADRIRDEFHVEIEQAVEQGRSAVAVWLEQHKTMGSDNVAEQQISRDARPVSLTINSAPVVSILGDEQQYQELRTLIEQRVDRLRRQLRKIGNVSTESLDNLVDLEMRFKRLHSHVCDLEAARDTLRDMVRRINVESRRLFLESFECIRGHFLELFRRLFGGGEANLILEDQEDVLDCVIDVVARPPGKALRSMSLLSGGEKTLTAVALLLSIFRSRPSPFCILDEVDASLDDANIGRFVGILKEFRDETQFIMITHRKPTMAVTDVLYGVTMEESGISKRLSVHFEEIDAHGNFIPRHGGHARAA